jgi:SAM-dependent methyltransferase
MDDSRQIPQTTPWPDVAPVDFWEDRYAGSDRVWSGRVNAALAAIAPTLVPGRALDLGCAEGADVIWLGQNHWRTTGIDISPTAIERARLAAKEAGLDEERATFLTADLGSVSQAERYDLVTASFLHSPVQLSRTEILRSGADRVEPGGSLLITSHAAAPPWADASAHEHRFLSPDEELAALALDPGQWWVVVAEVRPRATTSPDGTTATLDDTVVLLRREQLAH